MNGDALETRPFCADTSREAGEPVGATASRIEHWLLVEHTGHWPHDPLAAAVFSGGLRARLEERLAALRNSRLCLIKQAGRGRHDGGRVRVVWGEVRERGSWFRALDLEHHSELADLDPADASAGEPLRAPLLLVCTHGIRDRCCALYGQELCRSLSAVAPPEWLWQSSHVGGDRFAGNLVCLPEGLYFGRVGREEAPGVLARYREGRIDLDRYRGRSCHPFAVQAAELAVRRETGLDGIHDLLVLAAPRTAPDSWSVDVAVEVAGVRFRVEVGVELQEEELLTCKAPRPRRARRFVARSLERLPG